MVLVFRRQTFILSAKAMFSCLTYSSNLAGTCRRACAAIGIEFCCHPDRLVLDGPILNEHSIVAEEHGIELAREVTFFEPRKTSVVVS